MVLIWFTQFTSTAIHWPSCPCNERVCCAARADFYPAFLSQKERNRLWAHHAACVHVFVPPFEQSNQWTDWFSRNLVWALSRWKSPSPRTFFKSSINSNNNMADGQVVRLERHSRQLRWGLYIMNGGRACKHVCLFVKVVLFRSVKW